MKRSQANRAVITARATRSTANTGALGVPILDRPLTGCLEVGWQGVRRHGNKRSGKGGSSTGGVNGSWRTVSPSYRDTATHDASWSQTVRNVNV